MSSDQREYVFDPAAGDDGDPVTAVIELTSRKWTRPIVEHLLGGGSMRYSELAAEIDGISDKMLSESLEDLEESRLVSREVVDTRPVRVEYSLTETGAALEDVVNAVAEWTELYADRVDTTPEI
jgi:DNA-binding HxlR family transcriptional regulator